MRAFLLLVVVFIAGCAPTRELARLQALGVRAREIDLGWYQIVSEDGYRFDMPGIPDAEREDYGLGGEQIRAIFYDLRAEADSRGFLLRAFDARALDEGAREELRVLAEDQMARAGTGIASQRNVVEHGVSMHEIVVEGVGVNEHLAICRTFVMNDLVFQATTIVYPGTGDPEDARRFFRTIQPAVVANDRPREAL